jgi:hypothetical protein
LVRSTGWPQLDASVSSMPSTNSRGRLIFMAGRL